MTKCAHCGCDTEVNGDNSKPRSPRQLRRFFAVLRAMFHHWPDSAEWKPDSVEHLRKWALVKAGHRDATDIPIEWAADQPGLTKLAGLAIEFAIQAAGTFAFVRPDSNGGRVRVFKAKSIAFGNLDQSAFNRLNEQVEQVYLQETGLDPSEVLRNAEAAA